MATLWPDSARSDASAVKLIVRIVHLIDAEDRSQATLVERLVMGHERETGYLRLYLLPNLGEDGSVICIGGAQAMHLATPVVVIFRLRFDERVELGLI